MNPESAHRSDCRGSRVSREDDSQTTGQSTLSSLPRAGWDVKVCTGSQYSFKCLLGFSSCSNLFSTQQHLPVHKMTSPDPWAPCQDAPYMSLRLEEEELERPSIVTHSTSQTPLSCNSQVGSMLAGPGIPFQGRKPNPTGRDACSMN